MYAEIERHRMLLLAQSCCTEIVQRISKCSDMQHTSLIADDELNSLIYETFSTSTHMEVTNFEKKESGFLAHPVHLQCRCNQ